MIEQLRIEALGAKGDGIARPSDGPVFVPFALPGEVVDAERSGERARLAAVLQPSPDRAVPPCPHFGTCGGCDLQHASDALYADFKRGLVVDAFRRAGIEAEVGALVPCPPNSRRRAVFSAVRAGNRVLFGFHEAMSHRIAPIRVCFVVVPEMVRAFGALERLAALLIDRRRELRLTVTAGPNGLDVAVTDAAKLTERLRGDAIGLAVEADFARLAVEGEVLVEARRPLVDLGGVAVVPPPGGFLQAVAAAEGAMADRAVGHLEGAKRVADLFSGVGTFTFRLARASAVRAVEGDASALASLETSRRDAPGLKPITTERRDLYRRPLTAKELAGFDAVLFDPPRAGAEAQAREIARSGVSRVSAVSCNPTTLARDAALLLAGGYRLVSVTPVDQFLWSHHVEAVALFAR